MRSRYGMVALLFVWAISVPTFAQTVQLTEVSGRLELQRSGTTVWEPCHSGTSAGPGDRIRCGDDGAASLMYADGTNLRVKGATYLQLLTAGYRLKYGESWVRVTKRGSQFKTFTPNAVVSVRGTIYSVSAHRQATAFSADVSGAARSTRFINALPKAHLAGSELVLAMLGGLDNVVSEVKVFRGQVAVESLCATTGPRHEYALDAGHMLVASGSTIEGHRLLDVDDYKAWSIDFRRRFVERSVPAADGTADAIDDGDDVPTIGTTGSVRLLKNDARR